MEILLALNLEIGISIDIDLALSSFDSNINKIYGVESGLTISFSLQIPVFSGNEISFRNFGKFRWLLAEIFWIFKRNFPKNTEIFFPGN